MSLPTQGWVDAWLARTHAQIDATRAALLTLIDTGDAPAVVVTRNPSRRDRAATDRTDGRFEPTPSGPSRRSGFSDPTGRAVVAWEAAVQRTVTDLYAAVDRAAESVQALGLVPLDEHGNPTYPPSTPTTYQAASGAATVALSPAPCRRHALVALAWLGAAADALGDRLRDVTDPDVAANLRAHAADLGYDLATLAYRPPPLTLCACGCGRPLLDSRRPIRDACQKRAERARARA